MDPVLIAIAVAGLLVGATGTWSPCGFSMIETIGPTGHTGGISTTLAACATFAPFAVVGSVITFGALALAGDLLHGAGGPLAFAVAAAIALAAAALEARGTPIVPQVRRQLPIGWRASVPMPLAAAGYGVLLGLGFTTFILSYGVWALMGVALALGDPLAGLVVGLAFGVGRAVPIVALAPIADRPSGERACEAMAMRRGLYRGARLGDAVALGALALLLGGSVSAEAARTEVQGGSDPSASEGFFAYEDAEGAGQLDSPAGSEPLGGTDPAVGGPWVAVVVGGGVEVRERRGGGLVREVAVNDVDAVAVSRDWLVLRLRRKNRDQLRAVRLSKAESEIQKVARAGRRPSQLSAPALDRNRLVYARSGRRKSKLITARLGSGRQRTLLSSPKRLHTAPSFADGRIAYVLTTPKRQLLKVKGVNRKRGRTRERAKPGPPTLWSTALGPDRVYYTKVYRGGKSEILSTDR